jgi:Trk-type K+ transport system membrane component
LFDLLVFLVCLLVGRVGFVGLLVLFVPTPEMLFHWEEQNSADKKKRILKPV